MRAVVVDEWKVVDNKVTILKTFDGPDAEDQAAKFIDTLPDHLRGRYGLDVCIPDEDAHCSGCDCSRTG